MSTKSATNKEWVTPRLIARLEENVSGLRSNAWNPAVHGISTTMGKLRSVVEFAYMGRSEFEGGTTRRAMDNLQAYIDKNKITPLVVAVSIPGKDTVPVYVLAPRKFHDIVGRFLKQSDSWQTLEPTYFLQTLAGNEDRSKTVGWLDLNNQVLFFKDKDTFEAVRRALGIKTPLPAPAASVTGGGKLDVMPS